MTASLSLCSGDSWGRGGGGPMRYKKSCTALFTDELMFLHFQNDLARKRSVLDVVLLL